MPWMVALVGVPLMALSCSRIMSTSLEEHSCWISATFLLISSMATSMGLSTSGYLLVSIVLRLHCSSTPPCFLPDMVNGISNTKRRMLWLFSKSVFRSTSSFSSRTVRMRLVRSFTSDGKAVFCDGGWRPDEMRIALHEEVEQVRCVAANGAQLGVTTLQDLVAEGRAHVSTPFKERAGKLEGEEDRRGGQASLCSIALQHRSAASLCSIALQQVNRRAGRRTL
ncbi:hypothetical protein EYF80_046190 [Liparis tanakae]|uniref:Uncharacterized protein n=1 Tax=Liparis tanakae TaxID=230148 RepID=A0A4Z2FQT7_9TELE|nr:hypothetical protein EYF80_046190 [Liparis tanakae]